jgi:hypothetical protein
MDCGSPAASTTGTANLSMTNAIHDVRDTIRARSFAMKRLGAIVLFAGAVLISTHMLAPAEPPASAERVRAAARAALTQQAAAADQVDQVNAEVERLRKRLEAQPVYPAPARDPFRFGARAAEQKPAAVSAVAPAAPEPPRLVLPQLIAITTSVDAGVSSRNAVLAFGDNVQVVKPGETFGAFVVRSVGADEVELIESATGRAATVSLR